MRSDSLFSIDLELRQVTCMETETTLDIILNRIRLYLMHSTITPTQCVERGPNSTATTLRLTNKHQWFDSRQRQRNFLLSTASRPPLGQPCTLSNGYGGTLSFGVKQPGREGDHLPQTSAEVKKRWSYTLNSQMSSRHAHGQLSLYEI